MATSIPPLVSLVFCHRAGMGNRAPAQRHSAISGSGGQHIDHVGDGELTGTGLGLNHWIKTGGSVALSRSGCRQRHCGNGHGIFARGRTVLAMTTDSYGGGVRHFVMAADPQAQTTSVCSGFGRVAFSSADAVRENLVNWVVQFLPEGE